MQGAGASVKTGIRSLHLSISNAHKRPADAFPIRLSARVMSANSLIVLTHRMPAVLVVLSDCLIDPVNGLAVPAARLAELAS